MIVYPEIMIAGRITEAAVRFLDRVSAKDDDTTPAHLRTGQRGEEDAYFYLRRRGYVMVARNYRSARHHGEVDLIGWDKDVLCFIEVKTRTTRDVKPAEAAVDRKKRRYLKIMIRDYLRSLPAKQFGDPPQWRFDVITVYYDNSHAVAKNATRACPERPSSARESNGVGQPRPKVRETPPTFELFQNAALSS